MQKWVVQALKDQFFFFFLGGIFFAVSGKRFIVRLLSILIGWMDGSMDLKCFSYFLADYTERVVFCRERCWPIRRPQRAKAGPGEFRRSCKLGGLLKRSRIVSSKGSYIVKL